MPFEWIVSTCEVYPNGFIFDIVFSLVVLIKQVTVVLMAVYKSRILMD